MEFNVGDLVARYSYQCDVLFRIRSITNDGQAHLVGEDIRLAADSPLTDLKKIGESEREKRRQEAAEKEEYCYRLFRQESRLMQDRSEYEASAGYTADPSFFEVRGRVLHVDGDPNYLEKCTQLYNRLGVPVYGVHLAESKMPEQMASLVEMVRPDILVITGHDSYKPSRGKENDIKSYRHSKAFGQAVREARKVMPQLDDLVIFAGACQSYFEWLIKAGANFASSPYRVNIHALDPVYIAARISLTSFKDHIGILQLIRNTFTGEEGLGGLETKGAMRRGLPWKDEDQKVIRLSK